MTNISAAVAVHLLWNDAANEWEIIPADLEPGPLDWAEIDGVPFLGGDDDAEGAALARASDHRVTAEDLTQMLGFAMVRATAPANADVEHRPASPSLVGMLKDAIPAIDLAISDSQRGALIRRLLPIISSCDANADARGYARGRAEVAQ